jgi:hypothetical protein
MRCLPQSVSHKRTGAGWQSCRQARRALVYSGVQQAESDMSARFDDLAVSAAFAQPNHDGSFPDEFAAYLKRTAHGKPSVLFAFPPKAAGTFLRTAALYAVDGQLVRTIHAQGGRDAQFYLPIFLTYYSGAFGNDPMVSHVHMQALAANRHFIEAFDLKPVVMLRSIPDMLRSFAEMIEADPAARADGLNCPVPEDFCAFSPARKADFLIDFLAPWYAGFYATWLEWAQQAPERICLLHYAAFRANPAGELSRALAHSGLPESDEICRAAVDRAWKERHTIRFHRGEDGRGQDYFTPEQMARIARTLSYFPVLDDKRAELLATRA